jgi:hypothetical protein
MKAVAKKKPVVVVPSLVGRIEALENEVEAELDRLAEETRHANIPAGVIRQMWMARGGGNVLHAYLAAVKELGLT